MTNHINPAQEHLVFNLVRQKIILGIERLAPVKQYSKKIVLFMPEGEHHEIGLLFIHFLLKQNGIYVDYLGANLPVADFKYFISIKKPDYAFCHITSPAKGFKLIACLKFSIAGLSSRILK